MGPAGGPGLAGKTAGARNTDQLHVENPHPPNGALSRAAARVGRRRWVDASIRDVIVVVYGVFCVIVIVIVLVKGDG